MLTKKQRFDQIEYWRDPIKDEMQMVFIEFPARNERHQYYIQQTEVDLQDWLLIALEDLTEVEENLVQIKEDRVISRAHFADNMTTRLQVIMYA